MEKISVFLLPLFILGVVFFIPEVYANPTMPPTSVRFVNRATPTESPAEPLPGYQLGAIVAVVAIVSVFAIKKIKQKQKNGSK